MRLVPDQVALRRARRTLQSQLRTIALMLVLVVFGLGIGANLVVHERFQWPSWMPFVGQTYFNLNAQVSAVSGVLPGQGQAVTISGVTVGQISGVKLVDSVPVISMKIDPQYANRLYSNATVLLRPKTALEDMVAQLDPGSPKRAHRLQSGATLPSANTTPTLDVDQILAQLDADTRAELMELIANAGEAVSGKGGEELANVLRDFDPLSRNVKVASQLVSQRSAELTTLMGNLAKIATVLGDNENQITTFVKGNAGVWRAFADEDEQLQETIKLLPATLSSTNTALADATKLGDTMRSTFTNLEPTAAGLGTMLTDLRPFFKKTTPVLADDLRPFSIKAQPTAKLLAPATEKLAKATPGLTTLATELNNIVNELSYKSKGSQSYLFYVPWANHDTDSALSSQDGIGPLRQSLLLFSCGTLQFMQNFIKDPTQNPTLSTLVQLLNLPDYGKVCTGDVPKK
jgi:phospholipid/cholesterol/gamma-HCH transport system substrate-binding protein